MKIASKVHYQRVLFFIFGMLPLVFISGCMTVGYSTARDPNMVRKFDVTIIEIEPQNIYNALGASLVGPFASVEHKGQKITFMDATGTKVSIVQPISDRYVLHPTEQAVYIVDRGQIWIQPKDYPLPPEFAPVVQVEPQPKKATEIKTAPEQKKSSDTAPNDSGVSNTGSQNDAMRLEKLKNLRDRGAITQEDYDKKKKEILDAM